MPEKRLGFRWEGYKIEVFFVLLSLLPALYISLGNPNTILDWYSSDDGFYYFQVARNLAGGLGFTFDGLNPTNGFHPLWLLIITPIFLFAQVEVLLPLRLLLLLSALLSAGAAILLYRILKRCTSMWVAGFIGLLWIVLPRVHNLATHSGVEAGLNAFCILLFWLFLLEFSSDVDQGRTLRRLALLSLLGSLAVLARLDNAFLVGLGGFWLLQRLWQPAKERAGSSPWVWRASIAAALFGPLALVMLFYVSWNLLSFGVATPVSGQVKLWWGTLRNTVYGFPVNSLQDFAGQFITADPELGPWSLVTAPLYAAAEWLLTLLGQVVSVGTRRIALIGLGGVLLALGGALVWLDRKILSTATRGLGLLFLFLACLAQIAYYKLAGSVAQQPWYWIAEMLLILLALGLLLDALQRLAARKLPQPILRSASLLGRLVFAALGLAFLIYTQTAVRAPGDGSNQFYLHRARWLEASTEEGARVAITGAGNLAYFAEERTIINMDGLMNTAEYLEAMQAGQGADYLASLGVDYVFGNEYILTETNPYGPMLSGHLEPYTVYLFGEDRELLLWRFVP
ncbi:MAG: hypothetical protein WD740_06275 [Anaerolineales bacterium]